MSLPDRVSPVPQFGERAATGGAVAGDLPCRRCGYNLRGAAVDGRCPECGVDVALSMTGDLLRDADPSWVERLRRGALLTIGGDVANMAAVMIGFVAAVVTRQHGAWLTVAAFPGQVVGVIGWWMLATPDPSGLWEDRYGVSRRWSRGLALVMLVGMPLRVAIASPSGADELRAVVKAMHMGIQVASVVGAIVGLRYLLKLARRVPDDRLEGRAGMLFWVMGSCKAILTLLTIVLPFLMVVRTKAGAGVARPGSAAVGVGCASVLVMAVYLVFWVMYQKMLWEFAKRFRWIAREARQAWEGAGAARGEGY